MAETRFQGGSEEVEQQGDEGLLAAEETPEEQPQADERPEWLPDNFKSPEDFRRSYDEAQKLIQQQGAERNQYAERLAALEAQTQAGETPDYTEAWQESYDADPVATMHALAQASAQQAAQQTAQQMMAMQQQNQMPQLIPQEDMTARIVEQEVRGAIPDWEESAADGTSYGDKVTQMIQSDPTLLPLEAADPRFGGNVQRTVGAIRNVYNLVKAQEIQQSYESAGITQADLDRSRKLQARTATPGAGGRPDQSDPDDQKLAAMQQALQSTKI